MNLLLFVILCCGITIPVVYGNSSPNYNNYHHSVTTEKKIQSSQSSSLSSSISMMMCSSMLRMRGGSSSSSSSSSSNRSLSSYTTTLQRKLLTNECLLVRGGGIGGLNNNNKKSLPSKSSKSKPPPPPLSKKTKSLSSSNTSMKQGKKLKKDDNQVIIMGTGTATIMSEVFNLVKNIVGVAVLSLPASIATFSDNIKVLYSAIGLIIIMGILSGYGFSIIGKVCYYTNAISYRDAWSKSVNPNTSWIPALSSTLKTFLTCIAISMVLTDTFTTLFNIPIEYRIYTLLSLTCMIIVPLCWMKNLSSLSPFSLLGIIGMIYTAIAMSIRYFDGTYNNNINGIFNNDLPISLRPQFGNNYNIITPSTLILLCTLSTAYMAHFNAPKFYNELYNNTLKRYNNVVTYSFGISIILMGYITMIGFLTFGKSSSSVILNNYSNNDIYISIARIAVAISLIFTYPLAFQGCRDGILDLCNIKNRANMILNQTTILLLCIITLLAAILNDVGLVLAIGGATLGNALTYLYPALMYEGIVRKLNLKGETIGLTFSKLCAIFGIIMGGIGTKMAIEK